MISIPALPKHEIECARAQAEAFPLISIQQVAKQYGVSLRTLRRWQARGLMPPRTKHGKWLKYTKAEIAEVIAARQKCRDAQAGVPDAQPVNTAGQTNDEQY